MFGVAVTIDRVFMILPDVPGNYFGEVCPFCALGLEWAVSAVFRV